jgi:hypothetical protein
VCSRWPDDSPEYMECFTRAPTRSPTRSPTMAPATDESQPIGSPVIELISETPRDGTLGHCQGDCDGDNACISGLVCYERTSTAASGKVPGCTDSPDVPSNVNVCVNMTIAAEGLTNWASGWLSSKFVDNP